MYAMLANLVMYPMVSFKAQINKPKLTRIENTFNTLINGISSALDNGDCGTFTTKMSPPIWKEVCIKRYCFYKCQCQMEFDISRDINCNINANNNGNGTTNEKKTGHNGKGEKINPNKRQPRGSRHKGIFTKPIMDKGYGLDNSTPIPTFTFRGEEREPHLRFTTPQGQGCPFGPKCSKFHITKKS
jgi:hypothetical protein